MGMIETAIAAARAAGDILRTQYGMLLTVNEAMRHDIKLEVDRRCEAVIIATIQSAYPDHAVLGEEGGGVAGAGDYIWIIDPLDGTVNFYYGLPYFCTSVACYRKPTSAACAAGGLVALGEPIVGVVYAPPQDELFVGAAGGEATLNGTPIHASTIDTLAESFIIAGIGDRQEGGDTQFSAVNRLIPHVRKLRCFGAAAYDLCNVGCGRATGFSQMVLKSWDFAAARIIVEAAGGVFRATESAPNSWVVTSGAAGIIDDLQRVAWDNASVQE